MDKTTNNGWLQIQNVKYYGEAVGAVKKNAELKFSEDVVTIAFGNAFKAPTLSKATTADVVYSSNNEEVASVDAATGDVTINAIGSATITAIAAANDEYKAGSASYVINVKDPNAVYDSALGEDFTFENPEGLAVWKHDSTYGLKGSAYLNSKINAAEAYAVSPVIDLTGAKEATLTFQAAYNQYKLNNALIDVADFAAGKYATIVVREVLETRAAADWTELSEVTAPNAFSWNFFDNEPVSLNDYAGKKIQFAYKYVSTDEIAGTWEVKNIEVKQIPITTGIEDIVVDENAPVEYYNLQGVRVANPENGLYIRRQGNKATKVLVK